MPADIETKVGSLKASVKSGVKENGEAQEVRAAIGDRVLTHDGKSIIGVRDLDPFERMSVPKTLTVFVGTDKEIATEIKKLGLVEKVKCKNL